METQPLLPPLRTEAGSEDESRPAGTFRAVALASLAPFSFGYVLGYSSPIAQQLLSSGFLTAPSLSFFEALSPLGAVCGALAGGVVADTHGRKVSLMLLCLPLAAGWAVIASASTATSLFLGRYLTGFGAGAALNVAPLYTGEVSPAKLRGLLGGTVQLAVNCGLCVAYALGLVLDWRQLAWVGVMPCALLAGLAPLFMPESPRWLALEGRGTEAAAQLRRLRSPGADVGRELSVMNADAAKNAAAEAAAAEGGDTTSPLLHFFSPPLRRPLSIILALMVFQQLCGINAVFFSLSTIFSNVGFQDAGGVATLVVLATIPVSIVTCLLMDSVGRRQLLLTALGGCALGLALLSVAFLPAAHNGAWSHAAAVSGALIFILSFSAGLGPIPWLYLGELLPLRGRGAAASLATITSNLMAFAVTGSFGLLQKWLSESGAFALYCACTLLGSFYTFMEVPETKGRTLEQVSALLRRASAVWKNDEPTSPLRGGRGEA